MISSHDLPATFLAIQFAYAVVLGTARAGGGFIRLPETVSPDGNYCLAWGVRDKPGSDLRNMEEVPYDGELEYEANVEDFVVDVRRQKVVVTIPEFGYFADAKVRQNHHQLSVGWSLDSRFVIAIDDGRYGCDAVALVDVGQRKVVSIMKTLDAVLRDTVRQRHGKKAESERTYVVFDRPVFQSGAVLLLDCTLSGFVSKFEEERESFSYRMKFDVSEGSGAPKLRPIASRTLSDKEKDSSNFDDSKVEAELNKAYGALRSKLDAAGKEKLKSEELLWLKLREGMPTEDKKADFTRRRITELRGRAENF